MNPSPEHGLYRQAAEMTSCGAHATSFDALPRDPAGLAEVIQGVLLHEHWASAYGVTLTDARRSESHIRPVEEMLDRLSARHQRPLLAARPVDERVVGVCRHFTALLVAMLRRFDTPARARCGFGAYFEPGRFVDHWVCEYWNDAGERWQLVDAQIDALQSSKLTIDFDLLDVPRDRFLVAGDAWVQCSSGSADPSRFGIHDMHGLWFIAGNVLRDLAALNNMEMLPWDVWGPMVLADEPLDAASLALFDRIAELTRAPDASVAELQEVYSDETLRVPAVVWNAVLNREDRL